MSDINIFDVDEALMSPSGESYEETQQSDWRAPPHNIEAEQALLGAILNDNGAFERVNGFLLIQHFYEPVHGRIYETVAKMIEHGQVANPITLKQYFERDEALVEVGGVGYLADLAAAAVSMTNVERYGKIIHDLALRRELISLGEDMVSIAYDSPVDAPAIAQIESAEGKLFTLAETGEAEGGFKAFNLAVRDAIEIMEAAHKRDGSLVGVTTGLDALNNKLGGLHKSDLLILAGRPAMGKTALAMNIAYNAACAHKSEIGNDGKPKTIEGGIVAFFSLEMSADQLASRLISQASGLESDKLRKGTLTDGEFEQLVRAAREIESIPLYIDDTPAISISAMRTRCRRLKRQKGLDMIMVDYLQLMRASGLKRIDNRVQEISEITQGLKAIAKELNVPVMALSQLSRTVESREDKRPQLSDLRESGSIEQDADVVMFVYREEYYLNQGEPEQGTEKHLTWQAKQEKARGKAEVIIGKQRHGPVGTVQLQFQSSTTTFKDLEYHDYGDVPYE